jgi:hypothetical protein
VIRTLLGRISKWELVAGGAAAVVLLVLVVIEPKILEAPVENGRTIMFTVGGTVLAAAALVVFLALRVPPFARVLLLGVPFVAVSAWLLVPYFDDDVVDDAFVTSIADAQATPGTSASPLTPAGTSGPTVTAPVLLGSGRLMGLAGHSGQGDAAVFRGADDRLVLRLENIDIQNGPDLELYLVPGADRRSLANGSIHLGHLRGNVGNLTYDVPADAAISPGSRTILVWCEAFSVEFTGATLTIS